MIKLKFSFPAIQIKISSQKNYRGRMADQKLLLWMIYFLLVMSAFTFLYFYYNGLGVAYNDARSHLDIGRRTIEGLQTGLAQLGSVWLPLPHILMIPTIWNDFMWHSGLAGAIASMVSFIVTGILIYLILKELGVGYLGKLTAVGIYALNLNILYLQSTAMTELLLLAAMTAGVYELIRWQKYNKISYLVKASFWIMLSTLVRYDGWFLFILAIGLIFLQTVLKKGYKTAEGLSLLFITLGGFGIFGWLVWNQLIFKDALYFAFGPYSASAQQDLLSEAGNLVTKGNLLLSLKFYLYALSYTGGAFTTLVGFIGGFVLWFDGRVKRSVRIISLTLMAPFIFNVLALFLGHSVLYIQGLSGTTWFNIRYGVMMVPSFAVFIGFLIERLRPIRALLIGLFVLVTFFTLTSKDAVTIDDALFGASQKNVAEVSNWLKENTAEDSGLILISAASHDAIIFSSGMPMKRFIHEGTGRYWKNATSTPSHWAKWIIMRTDDPNDTTFKMLGGNPDFRTRYQLIGEYPFADIYQLKSEYLNELSSNLQGADI